MKDLALITDKEAIEIGNIAFRHYRKGKFQELYQSNKWKLHLFLNKKGKTQRIAIVDEKEPLLHVDNLWSKKPFDEMHSNSHWTPLPQYNWIEITKDMVIEHYSVTNLMLLLTPNSQWSIFMWLDRNGFMGAKAVTHGMKVLTPRKD